MSRLGDRSQREGHAPATLFDSLRPKVIWWGGSPRRWRIWYVHRSRFGGFREVMLGPLGLVWNLDIQKAVHTAIHGDEKHVELRVRDSQRKVGGDERTHGTCGCADCLVRAAIDLLRRSRELLGAGEDVAEVAWYDEADELLGDIDEWIGAST